MLGFRQIVINSSSKEFYDAIDVRDGFSGAVYPAESPLILKHLYE